MIRKFIVACMLICFAAGCSGASLAKMGAGKRELAPVQEPIALPSFEATAVQEMAVERPTQTPLPAMSTALPPTPTITLTMTPEPTLAVTPVRTLDTLRMTPPTLMLHRSNPDFNSVKFLEGLVKILKEHKLEVVTYQEISDHPDITATEQGKLFIITIDDVSLQAEIDPTIQQMITILREAGYPAVLGVVTEGKGTNDQTIRTLKDLAGQGWEIAMHTDKHVNLHELEKVSVYGARQEIQICRKKIIDATGVHPITLVLPYGDMVENLKIMYRENIVWAVGIVGGEKYRTTNFVYYMGREGPSGDAETTFRIMMKRFNSYKSGIR